MPESTRPISPVRSLAYYTPQYTHYTHVNTDEQSTCREVPTHAPSLPTPLHLARVSLVLLPCSRVLQAAMRIRYVVDDPIAAIHYLCPIPTLQSSCCLHPYLVVYPCFRLAPHTNRVCSSRLWSTCVTRLRPVIHYHATVRPIRKQSYLRLISPSYEKDLIP